MTRHSLRRKGLNVTDLYRKTALVEAYMMGDPDMPQEFINALCFESDFLDGGVFTNDPHIHTLEGTHQVRVTDWIARGVHGEFWPIKDDIFLESYELVPAATVKCVKCGEQVDRADIVDGTHTRVPYGADLPLVECGPVEART